MAVMGAIVSVVRVVERRVSARLAFNADLLDQATQGWAGRDVERQASGPRRYRGILKGLGARKPDSWGGLLDGHGIDPRGEQERVERASFSILYNRER